MTFGLIFELALVAAGFICTLVLLVWAWCWTAAAWDAAEEENGARPR